MNVTENVIRDLHVLVQAGEASDDSRALVEAWLAAHPALAAELADGDAPLGLSSLPPLPPLPADAELRALRRTRRLLSLRSWSMALGFFFTSLPLSFRGGADGVRFLLIPGHMGIAAASLVLGIAAWVVFVRVSRALRPVGF
jgi:anti-sigma factor RsiW